MQELPSRFVLVLLVIQRRVPLIVLLQDAHHDERQEPREQDHQHEAVHDAEPLDLNPPQETASDADKRKIGLGFYLLVDFPMATEKIN